MNELSLFTGAGGGVLGSKLLGHRIIGYVENNDYRQRVIAQRIKDGIFDEAPIFGDIRAFNREWFAGSYKGMVDVCSGGFPCQDLSCAGKGAGITGERSGLWFEMATTVRIVRPRYVFIENVPALLVRGFDTVLRSLFEMGYDAAWGIVSAADCGAPHLRKRLWILAHSNSNGSESRRTECERQQGGIASICASMSDDTDRNTDNGETGRKQQGRWVEQRETAFSTGGDDMAKGRTTTEYNWWSTERGLDRVAYGVANRVDRIAAIGDGQVPIVAAVAFECLKKIIEDGV